MASERAVQVSLLFRNDQLGIGFLHTFSTPDSPQNLFIPNSCFLLDRHIDKFGWSFDF
jgi:hypothetical protein